MVWWERDRGPLQQGWYLLESMCSFIHSAAGLNDARIFPKHCRSVSESLPSPCPPCVFWRENILVRYGTRGSGPFLPPSSHRHSGDWLCRPAGFPRPNEPCQGANPIPAVHVTCQPNPAVGLQDHGHLAHVLPRLTARILPKSSQMTGPRLIRLYSLSGQQSFLIQRPCRGVRRGRGSLLVC